ncbi:hypothetical protein GJ688_07610 [Heliobacillus mobilis]|uniref:TIR domain-containing protein n=1 Tax=Heliobacterium mobile TaxID=28064 RepID=A0A6I3SJU4_HELMO|nr:hypothetical protein [Heliobacterium mobile]MTV48847.1 hypothetical protein [Heliobacterium mobile]
MTSEEKDLRYDAVITCCQRRLDLSIANHLVNALNSYRVPNALVKQGLSEKVKVYMPAYLGYESKEIAPLDISQALKCANFLIVVCSPATPKDRRVKEEIRLFREMGRSNRILTLLVEGKPEESFPDLLREHRRHWVRIGGQEYERLEIAEPLAANITNESNSISESLQMLKEEKLRLLAKLLNCTFDNLRQRHRERFVKNVTMLALGSILCLFIFGTASIMQYRYAEGKRLEAENATLEAVEKKEKAEKARDQAIIRENEAQAATMEVERQRQVTVQQALMAEEQRSMANIQAKRACEGALLAEKERVVAEQQKEMALEASDRLMQEIPARLGHIPEAKPIIDKIINENANTLWKIKSSQISFDENTSDFNATH